MRRVSSIARPLPANGLRVRLADERELVPDAAVEHAVASERGGAFLLTLMQFPS